MGRLPGFPGRGQRPSPGTNRSRTQLRELPPRPHLRGDCHNENGWGVVNPSQALGENFHDATRFPLKGLHRDVKCQSCHGPFGSRPVQYKGLAFHKCGDCHPDGHEGQLAARAGAAPADCGDCHAVTGFHRRGSSSRSTQDPVPADGRAPRDRLSAVISSMLSSPGGSTRRCGPSWPASGGERVALVTMRPKRAPGDCSDCHRDPHQGQFAAQTMAGDDCAACHTTESSREGSLDHNRDSRFADRRAAKRPASCHKREAHPRRRPGGDPIQTSRCPVRAVTSMNTGDSSRRARTHEASGAKRRRQDCSFCHLTDSFKKTSFTHQDRRFTTFALAGKHSSLPCGSCAARADRRRHPDGATDPCPRLRGCHADFHHGAFRGFEP
jgi:hypothetical protein